MPIAQLSQARLLNDAVHSALGNAGHRNSFDDFRRCVAHWSMQGLDAVGPLSNHQRPRHSAVLAFGPPAERESAPAADAGEALWLA
jgi:hypothetical protein